MGTFKILGNTTFQCIPVTQPLHVANKHIFVPALRLLHCCTFLNSHFSPASEFAVKLLVHAAKISPWEKFRHFLNGKNFPAKFSPPEISHVTEVGDGKWACC